MRVLKRIKSFLQSEEERLFLWVPVLFAVGIGVYFALPVEPSKWIILSIVELLIVLMIGFRHRRDILVFPGVLGIVALGFASVQLRTIYLQENQPQIKSELLYLTGRITSLDVNYRGKPRVVLTDMQDFDDNALSGQYRLTLMMGNPDIEVGDCVEMVAEVGPPFRTNLVGGFQFERRLFFDGINGTGYVPSDVHKIDCADTKFYFGDYAARLRSFISRKIEDTLPAGESAVAVAIVAGNQSLMDTKLVEAYRDSGLAHFLSISGLHMSMIAGLMFFAVRLFMALIPVLTLRYDSKKAASILALIMATVYLVISGAEIPAIRAYVATFMVLLAVLFRRQAISMRTLAIAALIILVISPEALVSPGFQMSFAAVAALIAFYESWAGKISAYLNRGNPSVIRKFARGVVVYAVGIVATDLVASLATLPFVIYHFNRVAVYTMLTNFVSGPVIGFLIMPFVMLALVLMPVGLSAFALRPVGFGIDIVNKFTVYVASLSGAVAETYSLPLWGLILIVFGGLWLFIWKRRWRYAGMLLIAIGALSLLNVKAPDVIVSGDGKTLAIKNDDGSFFMSKRANRWLKQVWLSKYKAKESKNQSSKIVVNRERDRIEINGQNFDLSNTGGASFYINGDDIRIKTVREYIGQRPWN